MSFSVADLQNWKFPWLFFRGFLLEPITSFQHHFFMNEDANIFQIYIRTHANTHTIHATLFGSDIMRDQILPKKEVCN